MIETEPRQTIPARMHRAANATTRRRTPRRRTSDPSTIPRGNPRQMQRLLGSRIRRGSTSLSGSASIASQMESDDGSSAPRPTSWRRAGSQQARPARHRPGHNYSTASSSSIRRGATRNRRTRKRSPSSSHARRRPVDAREDRRSTQHFTEPPPRFSEAKPDQAAWRSSASAALRPMLQFWPCFRERDTSHLEKKRLFAADKGRIVTAFLENFFKRYVEYDFTAFARGGPRPHLEQRDRRGRRVMRRFWLDFSAADRWDQGIAHDTSARRAERNPGAPHLSRQGRRSNSARLPVLRPRAACR